MRQEDTEFKVKLSYVVQVSLGYMRPCLKLTKCLMWCCTPATPALCRVRPEDLVLEGSFSCLGSLRPVLDQ